MRPPQLVLSLRTPASPSVWADGKGSARRLQGRQRPSLGCPRSAKSLIHSRYELDPVAPWIRGEEAALAGDLRLIRPANCLPRPLQPLGQRIERVHRFDGKGRVRLLCRSEGILDTYVQLCVPERE